MAEDNRINGFAWFLAGLGVGALVGILYAPKSGRETRDDLANSARKAPNTCAIVASKWLNMSAHWSTKARNKWVNMSIEAARLSIRDGPSGKTLWSGERAWSVNRVRASLRP